MEPLRLAVALDSTGWHPAAWRAPSARPGELFTAGYWLDLVREAERGLLDFVTFEDALGPQSTLPEGPDDRTDQVRGRLDAGLIAARVAPLTRHVGLVPTAVVTHTEPFHISKAVATLDFLSTGRAGWQPQVTAREADATHFGRRKIVEAELLAEAADYVEVVRRLWDSWEDDAEIRDVATARFIDRDKLHYIDFEGQWFTVKGPSITPRPPQGQPVVVADATGEEQLRFAAACADVAFTTPSGAPTALDRLTGSDIHVFGDLVVFLGPDGPDSPDGANRRDRLDELDGTPYTPETEVFTGTVTELADRLQELAATGLTGFRLRPGELPHDLHQITTGLVPELQRRKLFRTRYESATLRGLLGLPRPANRYAAQRGGKT